MKHKELNSNYVRTYSNYVRCNMGVFMPAIFMWDQSKSKLFCDEIICINQSISKNKRVFTF